MACSGSHAPRLSIDCISCLPALVDVDTALRRPSGAGSHREDLAAAGEGHLGSVDHLRQPARAALPGGVGGARRVLAEAHAFGM